MNIYQNKVIVIGNPQVGKTSLIQRIVSNKFSFEYKPTIGVDFSVKTVKLSQNNQLYQFKLQLWDISGQEQFNAMSRSYYRNSHGCVIVVDASLQSIEDQITMWLKSTRESCPDIPIIIVLNKSDRQEAISNLNNPEVIESIKKLKTSDYIHVSTLDGTNVDSLVNLVCQHLLSFNQIQMSKPKSEQQQIVVQEQVHNELDSESKKKGCC